MKNFIWIFTHYFKRSIWDKTNLLTLILPLAFIVLNGVINESTNQMIDGYDILISHLSPSFMLAFQFFGTGLVVYWLHHDFKGPVHWRIQAAPIDQRVFFLAIAVGSWIFNIVQGLLIIGITAIFFHAHWGNLGIALSVLILISFMCQLIGILIFYLTKNYQGANTLMYVIGFGMMLLSGLLIGRLGDGETISFIHDHTPLSLGAQAIVDSGIFGEGMEKSLSNIGILSVMTVIIAIITWILGRKLRYEN